MQVISASVSLGAYLIRQSYRPILPARVIKDKIMPPWEGYSLQTV